MVNHLTKENALGNQTKLRDGTWRGGKIVVFKSYGTPFIVFIISGLRAEKQSNRGSRMLRGATAIPCWCVG
jgi:hypothetical protein